MSRAAAKHHWLHGVVDVSGPKRPRGWLGVAAPNE